MTTPAKETTVDHSAAEHSTGHATGHSTGQGTAGPTAGNLTTRARTELVSEHGKTAIADAVVAKIAGLAAREVPGVYAMGAGLTRALGAVRDRIPGVAGPNVTQGVAVEVGERQAAIDLDVIVEHGVSIPHLAAGIRRNVISSVEQMCGLEVTEVNIVVGDVHIPGEESGAPAEPRVQ
ncbi:Asp23/Gls24 family envelope stress response protein [Actinomadura opuntiae]|uniref:Asp23/Gls24 family envelope stress response protein n=1 Tax=Actinomadura sp. OS1-43 TaxID=604315 RepID=UPI00255B08BF|nr:Asp23/Gls24 family envelope stress response protein [Actinomadura sp. OS1-43]MDL4818552.1 Asp23/Gls24 family envelope stress response protein [Actinomadura sp. OS1-43]